ncbi:hypothetical protein RUE5091_00126 [Ruegeria denitrificans]|uniref:Uncharacterized protein n=1 Tax=Ruegeria denitrificans TaxID=1715692 RepID=A0A0P1I9F2_9RHOB|nr:hypothetical protein [Ruegeria denitrificans]CUJ83566.1 hypothetical protein RUE5091_00126 [Ruegeria denitrificans]
MTARAAFPFLRLNNDIVRASDWFAILDGSTAFPAGEFIPDWDYASSLLVERNVDLDMAAASENLEVPYSDLDLKICVEIGSGSGRLPRLIHHREEIRVPEGVTSIPISVKLNSKELSSAVFLKTSLVLGSDPARHGAISPQKAGLQVWSDFHRTRIEGAESRFPIEVASFREMFGSTPEANSLWHLHWTPGEWEREFHGAVRLYLNSDFEDFVLRIKQGDRVVLQMLLGDVVSQITETLLREDEAEVVLASAQEGSVAAQVDVWLKTAFGNSSFSVAKSMLESRVGNFRSALLSVVELPEEVQ